jgi:hypothetical protein
MTNNLLSEQLSGAYHSGYEKIIDDILYQHYAVVDDFFTPSLLDKLTVELTLMNESNTLKKAAVGKHYDEHIVTDIRVITSSGSMKKLQNPQRKPFSNLLMILSIILTAPVSWAFYIRSFTMPFTQKADSTEGISILLKMTKDENCLWFYTSTKTGQKKTVGNWSFTPRKTIRKNLSVFYQNLVAWSFLRAQYWSMK